MRWWFRDPTRYVKVVIDKYDTFYAPIRIDEHGSIYVLWMNLFIEYLDVNGTVQGRRWTWEPAVTPNCCCCPKHGRPR